MYALYCRLNCHVDESNVTVIRKIRAKMDVSIRTGREWRKRRHKIYRAMIKHHKSAQDLFKHWRF